MTVAELIQRLQALPDHTLEVFREDDHCAPNRIEDVSVTGHPVEPDGPYIVVLS